MDSFNGRSWLVEIISRNTISILHFFLTLHLALGSNEARNLLRGKRQALAFRATFSPFPRDADPLHITNNCIKHEPQITSPPSKALANFGSGLK
jgi:hypothetical protein